MNDTARGQRGALFNIQPYSIHDGPGIRTTVFLKGCPLACLWCQNPESQSTKPEVFFNAERCVGCGACVAACPVQAIKLGDGKAITDRSSCDGCGRCVEACPHDARELMGNYSTAGDVADEVMKDAIFFKSSGGGVTLSGGEPLAQPAFSSAVLELCKRGGAHTAIETSGFAPWSVVEAVLRYTDLVLLDMKHMDSSKHLELTGVRNEPILENARRIWHELHLPLWIRVPVIPGYNDAPADIDALAGFVGGELSPLLQVHLLPYHRLGEQKVLQLERPGRGLRTDPPDEARMASLKTRAEAGGLRNVIVGG